MHLITERNVIMLIFVKSQLCKHFRDVYCLFIYTFGAIDEKKPD